ncbi:MAG: ribonuclease H-like domain-containing protein [Armatimonadota bacterium]
MDELKRRIAELQRGEARTRRGEGPDGAARRSLSDLADHFPEGAVCQTDRGGVFVCETPLDEVYSETDALLPRYLDAFRRAKRIADDAASSQCLRSLAQAAPRSAAFIDTETAGFHGRPLFLIGLVEYRRGRLVLTQYFARNYAEEVALLSQFASMLPKLKLLVTFNGKAFDWPFVRDRMTYHRVDCEASFAHLDLLHPSRKRWRSVLPNCRLQTLERYLSGRWRSGDIPSDQIPQRYHDFVREQDARIIAPIFHHNRLDLIAMVELLIALVEAEESSPRA